MASRRVHVAVVGAVIGGGGALLLSAGPLGSAPCDGASTVGMLNHAPSPVPDIVEIDPDTPATITPLSNDTDFDGNELQIMGVTDGAHGVVVEVDETTLTYTPEAGFEGVDTFTYTAADVFCGSATGMVTVGVGVELIQDGDDGDVEPADPAQPGNGDPDFTG